jgi:hypothetical protein
MPIAPSLEISIVYRLSQLYLIGHGAQRPEAHQSWMQGDQVYLARAEPTPDTINNGSAWEFFAGHDDSGTPMWAAGDVSKAAPLFTWNNYTGATRHPPVL